MENLLNEVSALRRTIESKSAAIVILRNELQECQEARDKFRLLAEQQSLPRPKLPSKLISSAEETGSALRGSASALAEILSQTKEENKRLRHEVNEIRCRLHDAHSDLKVLRSEKIRQAGTSKCRSTNFPSAQLAEQERQGLIEQLESASVKCSDLEKDIRCLLEEKEELISEKEQIKAKSHRLNYILNFHLSRQEKLSRIIDLDSIISENRYLRQRLKGLQEDRNTKAEINKSFVPKRGGFFSDKQGAMSAENRLINRDNTNVKILHHKFVDSLSQKCEIIDSLKKANGILFRRVEELERRSAADDSVELSSPNENGSDSATELLMSEYNPHG